MTNIENFIWSKRFEEVTPYNLLDTDIITPLEDLKEYIKECNEVIWIRNGTPNTSKKSDLENFSDLLYLLNKPVILVTTDGDRAVPSSYKKETVEKILNSSKIIKWYTQNYDQTLRHEKLNYYPIGLDLHSKIWLSKNFFE